MPVHIQPVLPLPFFSTILSYQRFFFFPPTNFLSGNWKGVVIGRRQQAVKSMCRNQREGIVSPKHNLLLNTSSSSPHFRYQLFSKFSITACTRAEFVIFSTINFLYFIGTLLFCVSLITICSSASPTGPSHKLRCHQGPEKKGKWVKLLGLGK